MARLQRYLRIQSIHSQLPRSDLEIIHDASEIAKNEFSSVAVDYMGRLRDRGASIATFEIYSPYWLLPVNVSESTKHALSVASVVSASAIIYIDNQLDDFENLHVFNEILLRQANYWGKVAQDILGIRTEWSQTLTDWNRPRHGIANNISMAQIPLRKNPFYRLAALAYTNNSLILGEAFSVAYTQSLGIADDILDLVDDFIWSRPNVLLSALNIASDAGLDELMYVVIKFDLLRRYFRLSISRIRRARAIASRCNCHLLTQTCKVFEDKFDDLLNLVNNNFVGECTEKRQLGVRKRTTDSLTRLPSSARPS